MATSLSELISRIKGKSTAGLTPMPTELNLSQIGTTKTSTPTTISTPGSVEKTINFFKDIARDLPRSAGQLALKVTGQESFQPGTGVAPAIEKWLFGTEEITQPKGTVEVGLAILGAIPVLPGKKKLAEVAVKEIGEQIAKKEVKEVVGTKALQISKVAKEKINNIGNALKTELETIKGRKITYEEVKDAAKSTTLLKKVTTRAETLRREAQIQATKQQLAALAGGKTITKEFVDSLKAVSAEATNLGRQLNSLKIEALPEMASFKTQIVRKLLDVGIRTDDILNAARSVDFTNANEVAKFYRKFIKPTLGEVIDEYRYINLLSSPRTHIVNAFSNLLQTTVLNPATKLASGGLDFIHSAITGKARQYYMGEVPAYTKGMANSIGDAVSNLFKVMKGRELIYRPDVARLPTKAKLLAPFQAIPRLLEGSDVFFRTMLEAGEKEALAYKAIKQGIKPTEALILQIEKEAAEKSQYWVFRQGLNVEGQGKVLSMIDKATNAILDLRKIGIVKWFVPFVVTPMNILKQGIEFSPMGVTTLAGNSQKTLQLAKSFIGSSVMAGAAYLAMKGDSTWALPQDEKEKEYFYASGRQPYALKINDTWISYSKLGPLSYPIAMAAAINYYLKQNPKAATQSSLEKLGNVLLGIGGFFADQSYVQGIGDLLDIGRGDIYAAGRAVSNFPSQLVPLSSLQRWIANIIDPIFRETKNGLTIDAIIQNLQKGIPGLSQKLKAYKEPLGEESKRQLPITNALSPLGITVEKSDYDELYKMLMQKRTTSAELNKIKEDLREELGL